ncbi:MAG TPA: hypothetical protein VHC97_08835 [Thermoanaerobaculia bacterium]|jgi:hypothetical protein|nr:hypothetical protein [Thermoanaerobaculia bacterium]
MNERERLRALIEDLPENEVYTALRFLEYLRSSTPPESMAEVVAEEAGAGRIISHEGMHRRVFGKD